jgi:transposase-like protein
MFQGENVSALARELGIKRKLLYQWRDRFRAGGEAGLRSRGRPKRDFLDGVCGPAAAVVVPAIPVASTEVTKPRAGSGDAVLALAAAEARVAELERKVGRQALELDFFREALRRLKDARSTTGATTALRSTRSSAT